jgi:colanic acid biosynthesis glycosyl transferase WcaI
MRVVVWGINYAPEITGIAPHNVSVCEFLREAGHDVEMVTTFSYYPEWKKKAADRGVLYRTDRINGVPVHRCWHFVPERVTALKRIVHEATFALTSTMRVLGLKAPDVYLVVSPPLILGTVARFVSSLKRAPFIFHVQDLQPDAAVGLGMLREGWFTRALYWLEAFAYRHALRVSGISPEILDAFRGKGVPEEKLILYPNSVELPPESTIPKRGLFREKHGFGGDEFLAIYAGNLGVKQGLEILFDAAGRVPSDSKVRLVLCGDGAERTALEEKVRSRNLTNVIMLPLQRGTDYQELLVDADVSLVTQQSGSGNAFFPSKVLVTLAHFSPVVTVADKGSALADAVAAGGFGVNVAPGKADELASVLSDLPHHPEQRRTWGRAGRAYVEQFERSRVISAFVNQLQSLIGSRTPNKQYSAAKEAG